MRLRIHIMVAILLLVQCFLVFSCQKDHPTIVSISGTQWQINQKVTYPGSKTEGLLMNVRMVNATFEDQRDSSFNSLLNTEKFITKIPAYRQSGVLAFTFNLQGGMPGYEGAINSAYNPDGSLRENYLARIEEVIRVCDKEGMVAILGCFYQRQDQYLKNEAAIYFAIENTVRWIRDKNFTNVLLEIANEYPHQGFDFLILKTAAGIIQLIKHAHQTFPNLLVSASGMGNGTMDSLVAEEADFILIHFNGTPVKDIPDKVRSLKKYHKPIVCNEDNKTGEEAVAAMIASVTSGCSWGYMNNQVNQYTPFIFNGKNDDPILYQTLREITTRVE